MIASPSSPGGRFEFDDGGTYSGAWQDGMSHGYGVCTGPQGHGEFAGSWVQGFETSGVYTWSNGSYYQGQWLQGRRHGLGLEKKANWLYRGEWTQGYKGRYGTRRSTTSGAMFEGTWTSGMQDGYGVETYADGGTYQGQWLRGVRHGYGVRQSVSYDLAAGYRPSIGMQPQMPASTLTLPGSEKERETLLRDRDRRLEESRGGFVLQANTTLPSDGSSGKNQRLALDKHGKPSLRKTIVNELKLIRQRSTGDLQEPQRPGSRQSGGSIRSTVSTLSRSSGASQVTNLSMYTDDGDTGSFVSQMDIYANENVIERYLGEWNNDKRAGHGVCERSDGLRYEGEWANNRKHGYGVTTLRDGTRIAGKYKNNVLIASEKNTKLFVLRASKIRDRIEGAVLASHRAADVANEKAEIALARMTSARTKAEQTLGAAQKAATDSELARVTARQYTPENSQPGANIRANRLQEEELHAEFAESSDLLPPLKSKTSPSSRFTSLFRSKKQPDAGRPQLQQMFRNGNNPSDYGEDESFIEPTNHPKSYSAQIQSNHNPTAPTAQRPATSTGPSYGYGGALFKGYAQSTSPPPNRSVPERGTKQNQNAARSTNQPFSVLGGITQTLTGNRSNDQWPTNRGNSPNSMAGPNGYSGRNDYTSNWSDQNSFGDSGFGIQQNQGNFQQNNPPQSYPASYGYQSQMSNQSEAGYSPYTDLYNTADGLADSRRERRKSLPSIIKERTPVVTSLSAVPPGVSVSPTTYSNPAVISNSSVSYQAQQQQQQKQIQQPEVRRRPNVNTFVIEDGVRKKVKSLYAADDSALGNPTGRVLPITTGVVTGTGEVEGHLPKMYTLESTKRADMGSVPDVSTVTKQHLNAQVMPREVAYVMSQQRREELIRERAAEARRKENTIVLRLGDLKDWCERKQTLMLLVAINVGIATVFFNLLY